MTLKQAAAAYAEEQGGSCLNSRTHPGTPVAECEYIFCECNIYDAFTAGAKFERERILALLRSDEAEGLYLAADSYAVVVTPTDYANWLEKKLAGDV